MDTGIVQKYSVGSQKSTDSHFSRIDHNYMPSQLGVDGTTAFIVLSPKSKNVIEIKQHEYSAASLGKETPAQKQYLLN
jgi:hypothetical protein